MRKMSCTTRWSSAASASRAWSTSGSDIAGFSPMMYMPRILPSYAAFMISTTVRPGLRIERRCPTASRSAACASGVVHALVVRDTSSGSGPSRTRPARCSGRAADAGRVPGLPIWPVISASAIRQRALSVPCTCCEMPMPHRIIEPFEVAYRRARPRGCVSAGDAADRRHRLRARSSSTFSVSAS